MLSLSRMSFPRKFVDHAPDVCRCPRCGKAIARHESRPQYFWEPGLVHPMILVVTVGCYVCRAHPRGEQWFNALPSDLQGGVQYARSTKEKVVALVRRFKMPVTLAAEAARDTFHLPKLDETTVLDWMRELSLEVDVAAFQDRAVEEFSGQLDVDEVYDGRYGQLKATDPIRGVELDYELIEGPIREAHVEAFFQRLKDRGFMPRIVTTDGSKLYPEVIRRVWPDADHQRCVFHFIKQCNEDLMKAFWVAYHTMPKPPKRKRGRPKKRGRPRLDKQKRANRRTVIKARFLVLKRTENMSDQEQDRLQEMLALCPPLRALRGLVEALHDLFGPTTTEPDQAESKRRAILGDEHFQTRDEFGVVLGRLADDDLFRRLTVYLDYENAEKTSNHVERENREFRKRQKSHYRLRSLESICALLDLLMVRDRPYGRVERLRPKRVETSTGEEVVQAA